MARGRPAPLAERSAKQPAAAVKDVTKLGPPGPAGAPRWRAPSPPARARPSLLAIGQARPRSAAQAATALAEQAEAQRGVALLVRRGGQRPQYVVFAKPGEQGHSPGNAAQPSGGPY